MHLPSFGVGILELTDLRFCFWKTKHTTTIYGSFQFSRAQVPCWSPRQSQKTTQQRAKSQVNLLGTGCSQDDRNLPWHSPAEADYPSGVREEAVRVLGLLQPHHQNQSARSKWKFQWNHIAFSIQLHLCNQDWDFTNFKFHQVLI